MLDNLSLVGPDEEELSLSAVVSSATLLPACVYSAYSIIVNIMPVMGKRAALFYLTRGSVRSIWIPVAILVFAIVARKLEDRRMYALVAVFSVVALILAVRWLDVVQAGVYAAVAVCSALAAVKAV